MNAADVAKVPKPLSIYDVFCPYCRSIPGWPCIADPSGTTRSTPHVLRRRAFQEETSS